MTKQIPRVYVAGPYSAAHRRDRRLNMQRAMRVAELVIQDGAHPVVPHLTGFHLEHLQDDYEFWIAATMQDLQTCDACVLVPGWEHSKGSQGKHADCRAKERPAFKATGDSAFQLPNEFRVWIEGWKGAL